MPRLVHFLVSLACVLLIAAAQAQKQPVVPIVVYPQDDPLRVEIMGESHASLEPIEVVVTNISSRPVDLAVPLNILTKGKESFRSPLPIDVERHSGYAWVVTKPEGHGGIGRTIKPGRTLRFRLGVSGVGEYRARVWYVVDHGDPGPPARKPIFGSVLSGPFRIDASP
jgi:hypothetical protein